MASAVVVPPDDWETSAGSEAVAIAGAPPLFAATFSPDFAQVYVPDGDHWTLAPPQTRLVPQRAVRLAAPGSAPRDAWGSVRTQAPAGRRNAMTKPVVTLHRSENAWTSAGTPGSPAVAELTPGARVEKQVRTIVNKLPSCAAIRRNIAQLEKERTKLERSRASAKELDPVLDRIQELRDLARVADERQGKHLLSLVEIEVDDAECVSAFVGAFVAGVIPAHNVSGGGQEAERSLFEGPTQMCLSLSAPASWGDKAAAESTLLAKSARGEAPPAPRTAGEPLVDFVAWGPVTFLRALRTYCERRFNDAGLTLKEFAPYVKLVGYLIGTGLLRPLRFVPVALSVLARRLGATGNKDQADEVIHLIRNFLEIVDEYHPADDALFESGVKLFAVIQKSRRLPGLDFELSARAASEAGIFLDRRANRKKAKRGGDSWRRRKAGKASGGAGHRGSKQSGGGDVWREAGGRRRGRR